MPNPTSFLPLSPLDFQVLLVLSDGPLHGYGIVKAGRGLELGSLYRIVARLMREGLIQEVPVPHDTSKRKRRHYQATDLGRQVVRAEAERLRALLESDVAARLLEEG